MDEFLQCAHIAKRLQVYRTLPDMFDIRKDNGKFDMANGVFGLLLGLVFAVALFVRFAFPYAKDSPADNIIKLTCFFKGLSCAFLCFSSSKHWQLQCASGFSTFPLSYFLRSVILSAIRLFMKTDV